MPMAATSLDLGAFGQVTIAARAFKWSVFNFMPSDFTASVRFEQMWNPLVP